MKIKLAYGRQGLDIELPDGLNVRVVEPVYVEALADQARAVRDALSRPIASKPLRQLAKSSDEIGIVFNDITRPTPYDVIMPALLEQLDHVPDERITLFNATGTHRSNTDAELRRMLTDRIVDKYRIVQNDCHDRDSHTLLGATASGNDIWIHKDFVKCDLRILTGFIEPHFFAGFSGGGKAVMPGLALLETVLRNHCPQNLDDPSATWGVTNGNPVWEDIRRATVMAGAGFLLNVALNRDNRITRVFAGDFEKAYAEGCGYVKHSAMVGVPDPFDIVITSNSGYPLDLNLYQSVKGMSAARRIVRDGGSIIIAADCWDGIPDHGEYRKFLHEADSVKGMLRTVRRPGLLRQDMWQAQIHALICLHADVYFHSGNLSDEQINRALLKPCGNIEATVDELLGKYGRGARICVLPEGPRTIPYISHREG